MDDLRIGSTTEPALEASKWIKYQVLVEPEELKALLDDMGEVSFYLCGCVTNRGQGTVTKETFLESYKEYISILRSGNIPNMDAFRTLFSASISTTKEAFYALPVGNNQQLIRVIKPVIQLQAHSLDFSPIEQKFRPMILGDHSISWGIQFSFPQLFQDPLTRDILQIKDPTLFPNVKPFQCLQKWVRHYTIPTPFVVSGTTYNVPMRIGKKCLSWINQHPQLKNKNISIQISL